MNAIPTHYNGINFRSRLEAKWARFFDLLGWNWDYEPVDFDGYIPDFYLHGDNPCFVEVKPAMKLEELTSLNEQSYLAMDGTGKRILYLGATINIPDHRCPYYGYKDHTHLGAIVEFCTWKDEDGTFRSEYDYAYLVDCEKCKKVSFTGVNFSWSSHCCDEHTENHSTKVDVRRIWKEATNTTQYKRIFHAVKG